jgi:hypothetical protein
MVGRYVVDLSGSPAGACSGSQSAGSIKHGIIAPKPAGENRMIEQSG